MEWASLDLAPAWGRELLRAILSAEWALLRVADADEPIVSALASLTPAWVALWADGAGTRYATLTPWAAERLAAEVDTRGRERWEMQVERDVDGTEHRVSRKVWQEEDAWIDRGSADARPRRQPRVSGFAPLPFPDRVEAPRPQDDADVSGPREEEWTLLGRVVGRLRKSKGSKKAGRRKTSPRRDAGRAGPDPR